MTPQRVAGGTREGEDVWGQRGHGEATGPKGTETLPVVWASTKGEGKWHPQRRILEDSSPCREETQWEGTTPDRRRPESVFLDQALPSAPYTFMNAFSSPQKPRKGGLL